MKKLILILITCGLFVITACAPKTTYIVIQQPTKLRLYGEAIHSVYPGDILRVEKSKTCRSGKGTCWWVKNDKEGYGGIVSADEMKILHRVYSVKNTGDFISPKMQNEQVENETVHNYSNINIGITFQYPEGWKVYDDQEEMHNSQFSQLSLLKDEIENSFIIAITPPDGISHKYDFNSFKHPILTIITVTLPKKSSSFYKDLIQQYVKYKVSIFKDSEALIDGPINFKMNDIKWKAFSASIRTENGFIKSYSHLSNKGKLYEISAMCKLNEKEKYVTSFDKIIRSVKLGVE